MEGVISKGGETKIQFTLRRSGHGLTIWVKTHPSVEELMKSLGNGELSDVRTYGRHWTPIPKESELQVYHMETGSMQGATWRLDKVGGQILSPIMDDAPIPHNTGAPTFTRHPTNWTSAQIANLSFLRLVGVSEGVGVTFGVHGVFTFDQLASMKDKLTEGCKGLCKAYLTPVNYTVGITTYEMGG